MYCEAHVFLVNRIREERTLSRWDEQLLSVFFLQITEDWGPIHDRGLIDLNLSQFDHWMETPP